MYQDLSVRVNEVNNILCITGPTAEVRNPVELQSDDGEIRGGGQRPPC